MKIIPQHNEILGRHVDLAKTEGGLALPAAQNNATLFVIVDAVGPAVTRCAPGDIILPQRVSHIYLRNGFHRVLCVDEEVRAIIEDLPLDQCEFQALDHAAAVDQAVA